MSKHRRENRSVSERKNVGSVDVHPESAFALSVNDVLYAEAELEPLSGAAEILTQSKADKLWICQFTEGLVNGTGIEA